MSFSLLAKKIGKDGYIGQSGPHYFVYDSKLLMVFFHDGGSGNDGKKEVVVIDVPDELGEYFIGLMESINTGDE